MTTNSAGSNHIAGVASNDASYPLASSLFQKKELLNIVIKKLKRGLDNSGTEYTTDGNRTSKDRKNS